MIPRETRNHIRTRVGEWQAKLERLRIERAALTGEGRRASIARLRELQAKIAEEVRAWNAAVDEYDVDPSKTMQKEFEEQIGVRELERQITADLAAWEKEGHGVG